MADRAWDSGFYSGVTVALKVIQTAEGDDSTMFRDIVKCVGARELVRHADSTDLEMYAASDLTRSFVAARKRTLRRHRAPVEGK